MELLNCIFFFTVPEATELLDKDLFNESQNNELFVMLLYLAAQARSCLYPNFSAARHDFEELGEEEAAILHSAQAVLATPSRQYSKFMRKNM